MKNEEFRMPEFRMKNLEDVLILSGALLPLLQRQSADGAFKPVETGFACIAAVSTARYI